MTLREGLSDLMADYTYQHADETSIPTTSHSLNTHHIVATEPLLEQDADRYPYDSQHTFQPEDESYSGIETSTAYTEDPSVMVP